MAKQSIIRAVFIERDGILNTIPASTRLGKVLPKKMEEFHVIKEAKPHLERLIEAGFLLIATTHQPGISKKTLLQEHLDRMNEVLVTYFGLSEVFCCPDDASNECSCKKPLPGLILIAQQRFKIHLPGSFIISDDWRDYKVAKTVGCRPVIIRSPYNGKGELIPDISKVNDLAAAVEKILRTPRE
ncbi:MAG: HAD hydrolase-like protein [Patescibacteria group bacterium]